eukprot:gene10685-3306_t
MSLQKHFLRMASYHKWSFERVFKSLEKVSKEDYHKNLGLFFKSIHGTLNHLYLADMVWYYRITGQHSKSNNLSPYWMEEKDFEKLFDNKQDVHDAIMEQCDVWLNLISKMSDSEFEKKFKYQNTKGVEFEKGYDLVFDHLFNHGTHHKGQITAALSILGSDTPVLDLPQMVQDE